MIFVTVGSRPYPFDRLFIKLDSLYEAGIIMNGQIVLCKGINDRDELERSIKDLMGYMPCLQSVSVVPVGLSRHREGLYPLEPFDKRDAEITIDIIERYQKKAFERYGLHFIHASDEFYLLADRELPGYAWARTRGKDIRS